jgi:hypothetical protein
MQYDLVEDVFELEDGGAVFLRNVRKRIPNLMALRSRRYHRLEYLKPHMLLSPKISNVQSKFDSVCVGVVPNTTKQRVLDEIYVLRENGISKQ